MDVKDALDVTTESRFRVIVIGAGVAGLTASHCLQKAGIDHVVLERRGAVAPPEGVSIGMWPHGCRILHQIGCLEPVEEACGGPPKTWQLNGPDGVKYAELPDTYDVIQKNHASNLLTIERRRFLQILYDGLPDRSYIRTGCAVKAITQDADGVRVQLQDGSVESGDMVLGVDGISSMTRKAMWEHADTVAPGLVPPGDKTRMRTSWKALVGLGPRPPKLAPDIALSVSDHKFSFLLLTQPHVVFWFVFFRLPETLVWPERGRYTAEDAAEVAASIAEHPITGEVRFRELWDTRTRADLVPIEEGVLDVWHHGRIVLAGDAAHKVTPNMALGGNTGMESVAVLCNHLHKMLERQQGAKPSRATLDDVFSSYQAERHARVKNIAAFSGLGTRLQAWDGWLMKLLYRWIVPLLPAALFIRTLSDIVREAPKIDYVPVKGFPSGAVPWKHDD
ncbi:FAD/NAD(P)-binding domain-containing protein [Colletotrichum somersetense]|nr:FAD/NAD(P)-binding domain-containing protein [Colletotrichum somersetense]